MQTAANANVIRKIARIQGKPGRADALREALRALEAATRQEPGCVEFAFFQAISDENAFILLEHFTDPDAFQAHLQRRHTQAFFQAQLVESVHAVDVPSLGQAG